VLHAVALEDFDLAVVHNDRKVDDDLALGLGEDGMKAGIEIEITGGVGKLLARHV